MNEAPEITCSHCGYEGQAVRDAAEKGWECKKCGEPWASPTLDLPPLIPDPGYRNES